MSENNPQIKQASKSVKKEGKRNAKKKVLKGIAYVNATFNNTIITLTDEAGEVIAWGSPAMLGYKNARKGTSFVATKAAEDVALRSKKFGLQEVDVIVNGPGMGRVAAVKGLASGGLRILSLRDFTAIKHGGCKPRKMPRK